MPKLPRDLNGIDLAKKLAHFGYQISRQSGSHIRLTYSQNEKEHHITIPAHSPLKIGTLNAILSELSTFLGIEKETLLKGL